MSQSLPPFSSLPLNKNDPPYSAWGLYGPDDQLGTLNRLTDDVVREAAKEIQTGIRVSLDEPLDMLGERVFFGRKVFDKEIIWKKPRVVNDDIWTFNTQSSSQCILPASISQKVADVLNRRLGDGLRHFAYQSEQKFYNGVTQDDIHGPNKSNVNGIHVMSERGIVGRGILLDYYAYAQKNKIQQPDFFNHNTIKLADLQACARAQNLEIRFGDILLIRSGYKLAHSAKPVEELDILRKRMPPSFRGVERTEDVMRWIWENFSAVASDLVAFEAFPPQETPSLHEVLLGGWGCPIGEMFNLEELAETCSRLGRWSFFVTSKVNNVPGGVASPPNILAIF